MYIRVQTWHAQESKEWEGGAIKPLGCSIDSDDLFLIYAILHEWVDRA